MTTCKTLHYTVGVPPPEASTGVTIQSNPSYNAFKGVVLEPNPCYSAVQADSINESISGEDRTLVIRMHNIM